MIELEEIRKLEEIKWQSSLLKLLQKTILYK